MDQPARKRRKTTSPGQSERGSSPLKKPPRRPSFASPTKASIARFNPNLLPPRTTSPSLTTSKPTSRGEILTRGQQARAFIFSEAEEQPSNAILPQTTEESQTRAIVEAGPEQPIPRGQNITPRSRRASRVRHTSLVRDAGEEEDLPATPSRRMDDQDTPRRGVLFSSPSKRPVRLKDHSKALTQKVSEDETPRRLRSSTVPEAAPEDLDAETAPRKRRKSPDPETESRRREKKTLLRELQELENDVALCTKEIQRLQDPLTARTSASERTDLITFITKVGRSDTSQEQDQAQPVSDLLCSFLPFSAYVRPPPSLRHDIEAPVASHRPIDLNDPLPYLQMFTPLTFTSRIFLPKPEMMTSAPLHAWQQLHVDISGPLNLLTASLQANIDTSTHLVTSIQTSQLSSWADRELGVFARRKGGENDIGAVCWAIGSYWEIAKKRAEYRHKCEATFAHLVPGRTSEDTENTIAMKQKPVASLSRKELLRQLGQDVLVLEDRHILLKITWRIGFDWTGEAESEISIEPAFPRVWTETGDGESLKKIPETFNSLLQRSGAFEATRTMVALLFSE